MELQRHSGIPAVGELALGSHFCQFYRTRDDLLDCLIPYFKAGLESNERCIWVTSAPLEVEDARTALSAVVPDLDRYIRRKQIEFLDCGAFRCRASLSAPDEMVDYWLRLESEALTHGFHSLRVTGNASWVERRDWDDFASYEAAINECFGHHRIVGLCSYQLQRCQSEDVLDVVRNHRFALARRAGAWELLESSSLLVAKEQLRELNANLEHKVVERTAELHSALKARDEFLCVASHELKTPVATLELNLEALRRKAEQQQTLTREWVLERVAKTQRQCDHLAELVRELLDVARASHNGLALSPEDVDLAEVVRTVAERESPQLEKAGCRIAIVADRPAHGFWDRTRLDRALVNLLSNAAQHAPGSLVEVIVEPHDDSVRLVIRDDGPGIAPELRQRIFERFVRRGDNLPARGLGLGLWIVRQIALMHGGDIEVTSEKDKGTTFALTLPRAAPH